MVYYLLEMYVSTIGIIFEHTNMLANYMKNSKDQQQQTKFSFQYILLKPTIFIRIDNSLSFKSHCSVVSIHALRVRILSQTGLDSIYKCTFSFEQPFVRKGDDSCC